MNFAFFQSLSDNEAVEYLEQYLAMESRAVSDLAVLAAAEEVAMDFTRDSLPPFLKWVIGKGQTVPGIVGDDEPWWVRQAHADLHGVHALDEASKGLVLLASYYFGETFVRGHPHLMWSVGRADTLEQKMPVVAGFRHGIELATILVVENLYLSILGNRSGADCVDTAIAYWERLIPYR